MNLAHEIYKRSQELPEHAAREVLDFVDFLGKRYGKQPISEPPAPEEALRKLDELSIHWEGKPLESRDGLYDNTRDSQ